MRIATRAFICGLFLALGTLSIGHGQGSWAGVSQVVQPPVSSKGRNATSRIRHDMPSAVTSLVARFEKVPARVVGGEMTIREISARLTVAGVPVLMDVRSFDDENVSPDDDVVQIQRARVPVHQRITHALDLIGCGWTVKRNGDAIVLASRSQIDEMLFPVTYNISAIAGYRDVDSIIDVITTNVDPASWDEVGGPGSITPLNVRGSSLVMVSQTYHNHMRVLEALNSIDRMGGNSPVFRRQQASAHSAQAKLATVATPVLLPGRPKARGINLPSNGSNGNMGGFGGGMGGAMGGGMF